jgi:hypothetical protein
LTAPAPAARDHSQVGALTERLTPGRLYLVLAAGALLIGALSLLIPSTPSYDPWAWIVWGREIVHFNLQTTGGPSWKPLPAIFTTIFSLFGHAAPDLWLVVARAGAVMAAVMSFKIAWRLTRALSAGLGSVSGRGRLLAMLPALLAGLIAAGSLINSRGFISDNALGYSEGLMTALVLIAFDRHLDGARRQAFAVGFFAALDRPELWLLWGPYGLYLWWKDPGARKLVAILFALIPVFWFLPELWGSGHLFRGVSRAQHPRSNSPAFAKCPFCTEFKSHAWPTVLLRVKAIGLVAMLVAAFGLWRGRADGFSGASARARAALVAAGVIGFGWWIGISLETQAGFSGNDRYLVLGVAMVSIAGGVGWGWGAAAVARLAGRLRSGFLTPALACVGAVLIAAALFVAFPPWIGNNTIDLQRTHRALVYQAHLREDMSKAVAKLGASRILACGSVMTEGFQVPMLAWNLGVHTLQVEASPQSASNPGPPPNVIFQTRAQRSSHLLPVVRAWKGVHYVEIAHVRTFRVFSSCAGRVTL